MTWRHLAILIFWIVFIIVLAQAWVTSFVKPTAPSQPAPITSTESPPAHDKAKVEITDYTITSLDPYRMEARFKVVNTGTGTARAVRVTLRPWKSMPAPDIGPALPADSPLREVSQITVVDSLKPKEAVERVLLFDAPSDAEPPNIQYRKTFEVEFESE